MAQLTDNLLKKDCDKLFSLVTLNLSSVVIKKGFSSKSSFEIFNSDNQELLLRALKRAVVLSGWPHF